VVTLDDARALVGRKVAYVPHGQQHSFTYESGEHPGICSVCRRSDGDHEPEPGIITKVNDSYVFVRYGTKEQSTATRPEDLVLATAAMTTARTWSDHEGDFGPWRPLWLPVGVPLVLLIAWTCRRCRSGLAIRSRVWYSHDGAYEDAQYECLACGRTWWVDGIDS
jgi:hypothetical protein